MKKNRPIIFTVVLLIIIALYFTFFKNGFSTIGSKDNDFAVKDTASITKIFIANKNNQSVTLTRTGKGTWLVNNSYTARPDCINNLLYTINMITVKNVIEPHSWDAVIKGLSSQAIKVEIYEGDNRVKVYYVGKETADGLGTYMLLANPESEENYKQPYIIGIPGFDGFVTTRYFIKEEDWRDRTILQCYPYDLKSVTMLYPGADSAFRITINGKNKFVLDNPVTGQKAVGFDTIAIKQYLTYYQSISWDVMAHTDKQDSILKSPPMAYIKVEDVRGKVSTVKIWHRKATEAQQEKYGIDYKYDPDRLFALVNDKDFVLIQYFVFGKILQPASYFFPKQAHVVEK